jgi:recombination protein RecT
MKNALKTQSGTSSSVIPVQLADTVLKKIQAFKKDGKLLIPDNYVAENAMNAAWLQLLETVDKNKRPVLEACTKATIANSLFNMVIQGLNPVKQQCYFIAYGTALTMMPSYLGNISMALRVDGDLKKIVAVVVYAGDKLEYEYVLGEVVFHEHRQILSNVDRTKIDAAYALAITHDDKVKYTDLMSFDDIKQSWKQSRNYPFDNKGNLKPDSTHGKFTAKMSERTVINRLCKRIIGSSDDTNLVKHAAKIVDEENVKLIAQQEVDELANTGDIVDIQTAAEAEAPEGPPQEVQAPPEPEPDEITEAEKEEIMRAEMAAEMATEATADRDPGF